MQVSEIIALARHDLGIKNSAVDGAEMQSDLYIVADAMSKVMKNAAPEVGRYAVSLEDQSQVVLPFPIQSVESIFINGADITGSRVAPQQMPTLGE